MTGRPHLDASDDAFFGALASEGGWRLILTARNRYAVQRATAEGWKTAEVFASAGLFRFYVECFFPCGPRLVAVAEMVPECPGKLSRKDRAALIAECRAYADVPSAQ